MREWGYTGGRGLTSDIGNLTSDGGSQTSAISIQTSSSALRALCCLR